MEKKYVLTNERKEVQIFLGTNPETGESIYRSTIVCRIQAVRGFGDVHKGTMGGWVENELNLSHKGDCWVYHDACVFNGAKVSEYAQVRGEVCVYGEAVVCEEAKVYGNAKVYGSAEVSGAAEIHGEVCVWRGSSLWHC